MDKRKIYGIEVDEAQIRGENGELWMLRAWKTTMW